MTGSRRGLSFYLLAGFFGLFVLFLYGPIGTIIVLSFQGPEGGLTFPMNGVSTHWFHNLFEQQAVGDFGGSFRRSIALGLIVMVLTVLFSLLAGFAFRRRFRGSGALFYLAVASLIVPSILVSLGIGLLFNILGIEPTWYGSALGAHLTWTLPFGLLIVFAIFNRFNPAYEEAARDLGASQLQVFRKVTLPLILPTLVAAAILAFAVSFDEFIVTVFVAGTETTLPMYIWSMMRRTVTPLINAISTLALVFSILILWAAWLIAHLRRRSAIAARTAS